MAYTISSQGDICKRVIVACYFSYIVFVVSCLNLLFSGSLVTWIDRKLSTVCNTCQTTCSWCVEASRNRD